MRGHGIKSFIARSHISCAQSCLASSGCVSTNFKVASSFNEKGGLCELNDDRTPQWQSFENAFQHDDDYVYSRFLNGVSVS